MHSVDVIEGFCKLNTYDVDSGPCFVLCRTFLGSLIVSQQTSCQRVHWAAARARKRKLSLRQVRLLVIINLCRVMRAADNLPNSGE